MSFPTIPNVTPTISLSQTDVVNLLLASIGFEELALAHITNAEAEKIQAVVGTGPNTNLAATNLSDLLAVNQSVNKTLKSVIKNQMLLEFKLEEIVDFLIKPGPATSVFENIATATGSFMGTSVTASDNAFYHTLVV